MNVTHEAEGGRSVPYNEKVHTLVVSPCHRKRSKISTEVTLGGTVASMIWGEQPAIPPPSMNILVLKYVAYT